jgi:hypothetical protein
MTYTQQGDRVTLDAHEFHCFRLVLNPRSEPSERCEVHGRMRGDCGCPPRIEIMLHARSLVDLIHKCSLALCDWQAQTTGDLIERLTRRP